MIKVIKAKKARLHMLYALAPQSVHPKEANRLINELISSEKTPLCVFHDHFLGQAGGTAFFDIKDLAEVDAIETMVNEILADWNVEIRPLIFSHNPAALDEQIEYTISGYSDESWNDLKKENRPVYVSPKDEVELASD